MNTTTRRAAIVAAVLVALLAAATAGWFLARHAMPTSEGVGSPASASDKRVLYWYDPMVPQQHFDHPGLSPMGMQMVPKYADGQSDKTVVRIDPATVQNLGMRTQRVEIGQLRDTVHVPGTVAWDQRLTAVVSARTDATIEKLYVRAPYTAVKAGQPLAKLLAPQWSAAANEYFALRDAQSAAGRRLRDAARERLHALGMDDATIAGLRAGDGGIVLRAPIDGVVSKLSAREGEQVGAGMPIMALNGLNAVWLDADIPQAQSSGVHAGTPVVATVSALPDMTFHGKVEELLPAVDVATRTQTARIVLDNPQHQLAPGMFADVRIRGEAGSRHPLVPDSALIADGNHTRVIEALGDGSFKPVRVRIGRSGGGMTEILDGLHGGERIVTSGQFLIDSEASLSGALERLGGNAPVRSGSPSSALRAPSPGRERRKSAMPGMKMDMPTPATSASSGAGAHP